MLEDFFYAEAQDFLEQAAGVYAMKPAWWDQAHTVICFWLRRISATTAKWAMLDQEPLDELSKEAQREWQNMGAHLAGLVIEKAKELEEADSSSLGDSLPLAPAGLPTWMPTEVLKEIGYEG